MSIDTYCVTASLAATKFLGAWGHFDVIWSSNESWCQDMSSPFCTVLMFMNQCIWHCLRTLSSSARVLSELLIIVLMSPSGAAGCAAARAVAT